MENFCNAFVAIVDDSTFESNLISNILSKHQIETIVINSGNKLYELLENRFPDLIILEVNLDIANGMEICRILKSQTIYKDIPIIFIANKSNCQDVVNGFDIGIADYILSPFNKKELLARVKTQIELSKTRIELKEVNVLKEKMFSIVVHDLRSPFTAIMGFANFIMMDIKILSKKEINEMALNIYKSSKRAIEIMENFLEWAKLQIDKIQYEPDKINLSESLSNTITLSKLTAKKKELEIVTNIPSQIYVYADPNLLNTIVRNLISNAIKFSYPKSEIIISANIRSNDILISVKDFGVGIDSKNIPKLFNPNDFFSLKGTQNEKGTGIGLYLSKELVKIQSGEIWVKSELNKGSEFFLSLPKI